jgi:hypothetical protein
MTGYTTAMLQQESMNAFREQITQPALRMRLGRQQRRQFTSVVHGFRTVQKAHYELLELTEWWIETTHLSSYAFSEKKENLRVSV